jgi:Restriction endonuclease/HB1, ASXL, restriction endonuclease HTH domain
MPIKSSAKTSTSESTAPVSFADAAEKLLREAKGPLSHHELATRALAKNMVDTESQTPQISMHVALRSEIKRREHRGEPQRFVFLGDGLFSLVDLEAGTPTKAAKSALDQIRESRQEAATDLHKRLTTKNNGPNFELMVADLLVAMGYAAVEVIGGKDDQGVDIVCEQRDGILKTRVAIQCKCKVLSQEIGPKDISTLRDNLSSYQCQQGILVTTTHLNATAKKKASEPGKEPIHFIEHEELMDLFAEYAIGVRNETLKFYQVDASKYDFLKDTV